MFWTIKQFLKNNKCDGSIQPWSAASEYKELTYSHLLTGCLCYKKLCCPPASWASDSNTISLLCWEIVMVQSNHDQQSWKWIQLQRTRFIFPSIDRVQQKMVLPSCQLGKWFENHFPTLFRILMVQSNPDQQEVITKNSLYIPIYWQGATKKIVLPSCRLGKWFENHFPTLFRILMVQSNLDQQ